MEVNSRTMPAINGIVKTVQNKMIVRLSGTPPAVIDWVIKDKNGMLFKAFTEKIIHNTDIVVLVPGEDVFMTAVSLPGLTAAQQIKAIPFALEDHLAEYRENIHFAIGETKTDDMVPVAIVSKKRMDAWLTCLNIFFRMQPPYIQHLVPDMLALPWSPDAWTVFFENEAVLVKTGPQGGFNLECDAFWILFDIILKQKNLFSPKMLRIISQSSTSVTQVDLLAEQGIKCVTEPWQDLLSVAEGAGFRRDGISLLQGPYRQSIFLHRLKRFYVSVILLVVTCLLFSAGSLLQYGLLKYQFYGLEARSTKLYLHYFPSARSKDAASVKRMVQQLMRKPDIRRQVAFLSMLKEIAPMFKNTLGINITGIDYVSGQLTIYLNAGNFEMLNSLNQVMQSGKYRVQLYSGIKTGKQVKARFVVKYRQ